MIEKIKNLTKKKILFDKLELPASGELTLIWNKTNMTYEVFGLILSAYSNGDIDFLNGKGKSLRRKKKNTFYVLVKQKNGKVKKTKKTKDYDTGITKINKQFNEMMESYLDE